MKTKEQRIAELKKQILEIENEVEHNYVLVKVTPDCGEGICDKRDVLGISETVEDLVIYCENNFDYTPRFEREPNDGKKPCEVWYELDYTKTQIL